ncbi:hypothetical protein CYMTET_10950, partial [Cymbomonas tetramitiformis]
MSRVVFSRRFYHKCVLNLHVLERPEILSARQTGTPTPRPEGFFSGFERLSQSSTALRGFSSNLAGVSNGPDTPFQSEQRELRDSFALPLFYTRREPHAAAQLRAAALLSERAYYTSSHYLACRFDGPKDKSDDYSDPSRINSGAAPNSPPADDRANTSSHSASARNPLPTEWPPAPTAIIESKKRGSAWGRGAVYNVPNAISVGRLVSGPVIALWIVQGEFDAAFAGLAVAAISDWADGFVAKQMNLQSTLGSYLDPLADKARGAPFYSRTSMVSCSMLMTPQRVESS